LGKALEEGAAGWKVGKIWVSSQTQVANHRHRSLLRACRERPRCRAADNGDKFPSPHGVLETEDYILPHPE
jgi:hypothetical protein